MNMNQQIQLIVDYFAQKGMSMAVAFTWFDIDGSGFVTWDEFVLCMGLILDDVDMARANTDILLPIFRRCDKNQDGRLDIQEFCSAYAPSPGILRDDARHPGHRALRARERRNSSAVVDDIVARLAASLARVGSDPISLFAKLDKDHNSILSRSEFLNFLQMFESHLSASEQEAIFDHFDKDQSGAIDYREFAEALRAKPGPALSVMADKLKHLGERFQTTGYRPIDAFRIFDVNHDNVLTRREWQHAMRTYAPELDAALVDQVFDQFDKNANGTMNLREFDDFFAVVTENAAAIPPAQRPAHRAPSPRAPLAEEPWETEILDDIRRNLLRSGGMSVTQLFRRLAVTKAGVLTRGDFDQLMLAQRPTLGRAHLDSLFPKVNTSRSGEISVVEFVKRFG